jgi:probable HAF family extracellular repeat protein
MSEAEGPAANWYPDPERDDCYRYWDGQTWTDMRAPRTAASSQSTDASSAQVAGVGHDGHSPRPSTTSSDAGWPQTTVEQTSRHDSIAIGPDHSSESLGAAKGSTRRRLAWLTGLAGMGALGLVVGLLSWPQNASTVTEIPGLGGHFTTAQAVNDTGLAVGFSSTTDDERVDAYLYDSGAEETVVIRSPGRGSIWAWDVNDDGIVVGGYEIGGNIRAFRYSRDTATFDDLGTLGGSFAVARAINNNGMVVGLSQRADGEVWGFRWDPDTAEMAGLHTLGGATSAAYDVSDDGRIVGESSVEIGGPSRATLWIRDDEPRDLGTLGGPWSTAWAINDNNVIVGDSSVGDPADGFAAFIMDDPDEGMSRLRPVRSGVVAESATAISNTGWVVGHAASEEAGASMSSFVYDHHADQEIELLDGEVEAVLGISNSDTIVYLTTDDRGAVSAGLAEVNDRSAGSLFSPLLGRHLPSGFLLAVALSSVVVAGAWRRRLPARSIDPVGNLRPTDVSPVSARLGAGFAVCLLLLGSLSPVESVSAQDLSCDCEEHEAYLAEVERYHGYVSNLYERWVTSELAQDELEQLNATAEQAYSAFADLPPDLRAEVEAQRQAFIQADDMLFGNIKRRFGLWVHGGVLTAGVAAGIAASAALVGFPLLVAGVAIASATAAYGYYVDPEDIGETILSVVGLSEDESAPEAPSAAADSPDAVAAVVQSAASGAEPWLSHRYSQVAWSRFQQVYTGGRSLSPESYSVLWDTYNRQMAYMPGHDVSKAMKGLGGASYIAELLSLGAEGFALAQQAEDLEQQKDRFFQEMQDILDSSGPPSEESRAAAESLNAQYIFDSERTERLEFNEALGQKLQKWDGELAEAQKNVNICCRPGDGEGEHVDEMDADFLNVENWETGRRGVLTEESLHALADRYYEAVRSGDAITVCRFLADDVGFWRVAGVSDGLSCEEWVSAVLHGYCDDAPGVLFGESDTIRCWPPSRHTYENVIGRAEQTQRINQVVTEFDRLGARRIIAELDPEDVQIVLPPSSGHLEGSDARRVWVGQGPSQGLFPDAPEGEERAHEPLWQCLQFAQVDGQWRIVENPHSHHSRHALVGC